MKKKNSLQLFRIENTKQNTHEVKIGKRNYGNISEN